jgi:hypothetical protein
MIETLITTPDTAERVRDRVAEILATESAAQVALAEAAPVDATPWALEVYTERANAWAEYTDPQAGAAPYIVNVWFEGDTFAKQRGTVGTVQTATGTFNVDCYAFGATSGGDAGDELAATRALHVASLCRAILMSGAYPMLGFPRGVIGSRWVQSRTMFVPQFDGQSAQHVVAARLSIAVEYDETAPLATPVTLERTVAELTTPDGAAIATAEYDYT